MDTKIMRGTLPQVRWSAVLAGVAFALGVHVCLGLFGASLGFAAEGRDSRALGFATAAFALMSAFTSAFVGAAIAARLSASMDHRSAFLHGGLVWSVALVAGALFLSGTVAGSAMGTGYLWNGGIVANDGGRDTGPGSPVDSAAREASTASLLGGIAALAGLAGALTGAAIGRHAFLQPSASKDLRPAKGDGEERRIAAAARTPGMMPPPSVERRADNAVDTIWSDPAFDRRRGVMEDRRRH